MNSQSIITLFHGSPHNIDDKLKPSKPRGNNEFQKMKAVFATDLEKVAQNAHLLHNCREKIKIP